MLNFRYSPWCDILGQHGWDANFDSMRVTVFYTIVTKLKDLKPVSPIYKSVIIFPGTIYIVRTFIQDTVYYGTV